MNRLSAVTASVAAPYHATVRVTGITPEPYQRAVIFAKWAKRSSLTATRRMTSDASDTPAQSSASRWAGPATNGPGMVAVTARWDGLPHLRHSRPAQ